MKKVFILAGVNFFGSGSKLTTLYAHADVAEIKLVRHGVKQQNDISRFNF